MPSLLALMVWGGVGCAHAPERPPAPAAPRPPPAEGAWSPTLHEARRYYLLALLLAEAGELDQAERAAERAALFDPDSPGMALGFGRTLAALGERERAIPYLSAAVERGAGWEARAALVALYLELDREAEAAGAVAAWSAIEASPAERRQRAHYRLLLGDAAGAAADLAVWLAAAPDDEEALREYLQAAGRARLWASALEVLTELSEARPESVAAWRSLAQVAVHVGSEPLAARAAERWDALSGGRDPEAVLELARSALRREAVDEVEVLLARLRALEEADRDGGPPGPDQRSLEAGLLALAGDVAGARAVLARGLEDWPGDRVLSLRLAEIEADAGDLAAARAALAGAEGLTEGSRARIEARFLVSAGDREAAEAVLLDALETGELEVVLTLAGVLIDGGEPERAAELLEGVLAREHPSPGRTVQLTWRLAQALDAAGRAEEALDRALYTLELDGDHRQAMAYVGLAYAGRGDYSELAAEYLRLALEAAPLDTRLMDALAQIYYQAGNHEEALGWLERAAELQPGGTRPR